MLTGQQSNFIASAKDISLQTELEIYIFENYYYISQGQWVRSVLNRTYRKLKIAQQSQDIDLRGYPPVLSC